MCFGRFCAWPIRAAATPLAYEAEAGEEPISVHELRLPERPGGKLSRYMATDDPKAKESAYTYIDKGRKSGTLIDVLSR